MKGYYEVGYTINQKMQMKLLFGKNTIIGGFNVAFHRRCLYVYQTKTKVEAMVISQIKWKRLEK